MPAHHSVENFAQAIRAIGEPIHNRTAEEISMAKLLTLLLEVTGLFDMRTRPELILLQKTMVVVEGVARSFDPKLDIWTSRRARGARMDRAQSRPDRAHPGRGGRRRRARPGAGRPAGDRRARRWRCWSSSKTMTREGLVLSPETVAAIGRAEGRRSRWRTAALWVIAADLHRDSGSLIRQHMIAMQSYVLALLSTWSEIVPMASLTIRKLDDAIRRRNCGCARPATAARSRTRCG